MSTLPRYLNLDGSAHGKPLWKTFHETAGFQVGILTAAFNVAGSYLVNGAENISHVATFSMVGATFAAASAKWCENLFIHLEFGHLSSSKDLSKGLVIDTSPDSSAQTTSFQNIQKARKLGIISSVQFLGMAAIAISDLVNSKTLKEASMYMNLGLPFVATFLACSLRFNRVVKGEYAIVDAPPKEKKQEKFAPASYVFNPS